MANGVGLSIGATECVAAIVAGPESDPQYVLRGSVLHLSADGPAVLGGIAPTGYPHSVVNFASMIGSPAGVVVAGGEPFRAEDLVATALDCLLTLACEHVTGPAAYYATHPADWPPAHVTLLGQALDARNRRDVVLIPSVTAQMSAPKAAALEAARMAYVIALSAPSTDGAGEDDINSTVLPVIHTDAEPLAYSAVPPSPPLPDSLGDADAAAAPKSPTRNTMLMLGAAAAMVAVAGVVAGIGLHSKSPHSDNGHPQVTTSGTVAPPAAPTPAAATAPAEPTAAPIAAVTLPPPPVTRRPAPSTTVRPPVSGTTSPRPTTPTPTSTSTSPTSTGPTSTSPTATPTAPPTPSTTATATGSPIPDLSPAVPPEGGYYPYNNGTENLPQAPNVSQPGYLVYGRPYGWGEPYSSSPPYIR